MSLSLNAGTGLDIKPEETIIDAVQPVGTATSDAYRVANMEVFTDGGEEVDDMYADTPADMLLAPSTEAFGDNIKATISKVYQWLKQFIAKILARIKAFFGKTSAKDIKNNIKEAGEAVEKAQQAENEFESKASPEIKQLLNNPAPKEEIRREKKLPIAKVVNFVEHCRNIVEKVNSNSIHCDVYFHGDLKDYFIKLSNGFYDQGKLILEGIDSIGRTKFHNDDKTKELVSVTNKLKDNEFIKIAKEFEQAKESVKPIDLKIQSFNDCAELRKAVKRYLYSMDNSFTTAIDNFYESSNIYSRLEKNLDDHMSTFKEGEVVPTEINQFLAQTRITFKVLHDLVSYLVAYHNSVVSFKQLTEDYFGILAILNKSGNIDDLDATVENYDNNHELQEIEDLESTIESFIKLNKVIATEGMSLSYAQEAVAIDPTFPMRSETMYTSIPTGTLLTPSTEAIGEKIKAGISKVYLWLKQFIAKIVARIQDFFGKNKPSDIKELVKNAETADAQMQEAKQEFESNAPAEIKKLLNNPVSKGEIRKERDNMPPDVVVKLIDYCRNMVVKINSNKTYCDVYFHGKLGEQITPLVKAAGHEVDSLKMLLGSVISFIEDDGKGTYEIPAVLKSFNSVTAHTDFVKLSEKFIQTKDSAQPYEKEIDSFLECAFLASDIKIMYHKQSSEILRSIEIFSSLQTNISGLRRTYESIESLLETSDVRFEGINNFLSNVRTSFKSFLEMFSFIVAYYDLLKEAERLPNKIKNVHDVLGNRSPGGFVSNEDYNSHELQEIIDLSESNEAALNRVVDYFGNVNMLALNTEIAKESYDNTPASIDFDDGEFDMQSLKGSFDIGLEAVTDDSRSTFTKVIDWIVKKIRVIFAKVKSLFAKKEKAFSKEDIRDPYEKFLDNLNKVKSASVDLSKSNYMHELAKACLSVKINYDSNLFLASFDIHGRATTSQELDRCFKALRKIGNDLKSSSSLNNPVDFAKTVRDTTDKIDTTNSFFKSVGETNRSVSKTADGMLKYLTTYGNNVSDLGDAKVDLNLSMFFDELDKDIFKANEKLKQTDGTNGEKDLATAFLALSSKLSTFFATVIRGRGTIESSLENVNRDLEHLLKQITKSSNESYSSVDPEQYLENVDFEADLQSFVSLTELGLEGNEDKRSRISKIIDWIKARIKNMFAKLREFYNRARGKVDYDMSSLEASLKSVKESNLNLDKGKNKAYMENLKARLMRLLRTEPLLYSIYIGAENKAYDYLKDAADSIKELTAITKIRMKTISQSEVDEIYSKIKVINRKMEISWLTGASEYIAEPNSPSEILKFADDCIKALGTLFKLTKESSLMASSITELESSIERFIGEMEIKAGEMYVSNDDAVFLTGASLRTASSNLGSIITNIVKNQMRIFNSDSASRSSEGIKSSLDEILGVKEIESNESVSVDATDSLMGHTPKALRGISQDAVNTAPIEANDRTPSSLTRFGNSAAYADYV